MSDITEITEHTMTEQEIENDTAVTSSQEETMSAKEIASEELIATTTIQVLQKRYSLCKSKSNVLLVCSRCSEPDIKVKDMEKHMRLHGIPYELCVWCLKHNGCGLSDKKQKYYEFLKHRHECLVQFLKRNKSKVIVVAVAATFPETSINVKIKKIQAMYCSYRKNCKTLLACQECSQKFKAIEMDNHMKTHHGINPQNLCIWCLNFRSDYVARKRHTSNKNSYFDFLKHVNQCVRDYLQKQRGPRETKSTIERRNKRLLKLKQTKDKIDSANANKQNRIEKLYEETLNPEQIIQLQEVQQQRQNLTTEMDVDFLIPSQKTSSFASTSSSSSSSLPADLNCSQQDDTKDSYVCDVIPDAANLEDDSRKLEEIIMEQQGSFDKKTVNFFKNPPVNELTTKFDYLKRHEKFYPGLYSDLSEFILQSYQKDNENCMAPPPSLASFVNEIPDWVINTEGISPGKNYKLYHTNFELDKAMNLDMRYLRAFYWKENLVWYHVSVRVSAWKSFCEDFLAVYGYKMHFLPHWCLCNGGREEHRHMICVLRSVDKYIMTVKFKDAVVYTPSPFHPKFPEDSSSGIERRLNAKFKREIKRTFPLQLINTINYVSSEQSSCLALVDRIGDINKAANISEFLGYKPFLTLAQRKAKNDTELDVGRCGSNDGCTAVYDPKTRNNKRGTCHYYINKYLGPYCPLYAALIHPRGVNMYLELKYKQCLPGNEKSLRRENNKKRGRWMINCRDMAYEKSLVCPIPRNHMFEKVNNTRELWLQLKNRSETYREPCIGYVFVGLTIFRVVENNALLLLSDKEWVEFQMRNGNIFFFNMGQESFFLGKKAQEYLNRYDDEFKLWVKIMRQRDETIMQLDEKIKEQRSLLDNQDVKMKTMCNQIESLTDENKKLQAVIQSIKTKQHQQEI